MHQYLVEVYTGIEPAGNTEAQVYINLFGQRGDTGIRKMLKSTPLTDKNEDDKTEETPTDEKESDKKQDKKSDKKKDKKKDDKSDKKKKGKDAEDAVDDKQKEPAPMFSLGQVS